MQSIIDLTSDDLALLHRGEPLRVRTNEEEVVVVLAEQYERLKQFVEFDDTDPKSLYPLIADVASADWEDLSDYPNAEQV